MDNRLFECFKNLAGDESGFKIFKLNFYGVTCYDKSRNYPADMLKLIYICHFFRFEYDDRYTMFKSISCKNTCDDSDFQRF